MTALFTAAEEIAKQEKSRQDYTLLLRVAATLGLRLGEILGLRWQDFSKSDGELRVVHQLLRTGNYGPPKTKAGVRTIPLPEDLKEALVAHRLASKFSQDEHPIFVSRNGTPLSHRNVTRRGFEAARDKAGLDESLVFHDLRHAAASRLIHSRRLSPVQVAGILGHQVEVLLKVYAGEFEGDGNEREDIRAALSGVGGS